MHVIKQKLHPMDKIIFNRLTDPSISAVLHLLEWCDYLKGNGSRHFLHHSLPSITIYRSAVDAMPCTLLP